MAVYSYKTEPAGSGGVKTVIDTVVDSGDGLTKAIAQTGILIGVDGGPYTGVSSSNALPVSIASAVAVNDNSGSLTVDGTVAATQSGTWQVRLDDSSGNGIPSAITHPSETSRGLIVRGVGKFRLGSATGYVSTTDSDSKTGQDVRVVIPAMTNAVSSAFTNAPVLIQAGATELIFLQIENRDSAKNYLQIFDAASAGAVTLGTTAPNLSLHVPTGESKEFYLNAKLVAGLVVAATTEYSNSTAPSTLPVVSYSFR